MSICYLTTTTTKTILSLEAVNQVVNSFLQIIKI